MATSTNTLYQHPTELLQHLIRFDTTNPPGNERECILFIRDLLAAAGIESTLLARTPERPNLVTRIKGAGQAPPLLLYGHVDVVTTAGQDWQYPPFEGRLVDGFIWGRGALDMKSGVAMLLSAFIRAKTEGVPLPGDVIFTAVADEENFGEFGAKYLVEEHTQYFEGVRYALGEFGGFNLNLVGKRFYPIMIAEKQICSLRATFRGPGGHGSIPVSGGAMARLGQALAALDRHKLPLHINPPARLMFKSLASGLPGLNGFILRQLTNPLLADLVLKLLGERADLFSPLIHNTASPTMLEASDKINVIPSQVTLGLDGRLVPGSTPEQMMAELHALIGEDVELEVFEYEPCPTEADMGLYDMLAGVIREADPEGIPIPNVLTGVTDARFFTNLGIQTYGFVPLRLPDDFNFISTVHAANERVPAAALDFGAQAIFTALQRFS